METARLNKRVLLYIINFLFYIGVGFAVASPFINVLHVHIAIYILISFGMGIILSFVLDFILLIITKGYTIGSAIFGIKYVSGDGKKITKKQAFIRSAYESIFIFVILDLIYFLKYRTERGVIDRLSDSFAIDTRLE